MVKADEKPMEVTIDGRVYDVSSLDGRHPGGGVFKFYLGEDATIAFNEFHGRSPRAFKWLKTLKSKPVAEELSPLEQDFRKFRQELVDEGWFEPSYPHLIYRCLELILMHYIGFKLMFSGYYVASSLVLGVVAGRCGWLMHEFGHGSGTGVMWFDRRVQELIYGLGDGMSAGWWRSQHNRHHANPQHLKNDVDLQTLPLVAFHSEIAKKGNPVWLRLQAYLFLPVITLLVTFGWQFFLHPQYMIRKQKWMELFWLATRYALIGYYIVPAIGFGMTVAMYVTAALFGGIYIFGHFAMSHTHKPVVAEGEHKDWVRYSVEHTTNLSPHPLTDWVMSYLNYQIEHHLFPQMPQYRFAALSPRVRQWATERGLDYDVRGYWRGLYDTLVNLDEVGKSAGQHSHSE